MSRHPTSLTHRVRLQLATAIVAASGGSALGFAYARYELGDAATRGLTAMYASFGAVAALMVVRLGLLMYRIVTDR